jgi:group II intron reverse transcriptase/maturase
LSPLEESNNLQRQFSTDTDSSFLSLKNPTEWQERWFLSSNAKDIGTLYLMFALFSGLVGTAFSVLIRLELSAPGVQYIADNQLYNSIITAHAILMSTPLCLDLWLMYETSTNESSCVKRYQGGRIEFYGETQTPKLILKEFLEINVRILGIYSDLIYVTFRLTNLKHNILHNRNFAKWTDGADALFSLIISLVLKILSKNNGISRKENKNYARNLTYNTKSRNCGITYGNLIEVPKNRINLGPQRGGDGVIVVGKKNWRVTVSNLQVRTLTSKAGNNATRGSDTNKTLDSLEVNIKAISNYKNLVSAYELIKSNPDNMTKGVSNETLDGMNQRYLENVQTKLKAGKFNFNPAIRIQIPKLGKKETRPLTIASPREKIVQKAMLLIMERLYEPKFLSSSHGFRPGKGTHTAIKQLESCFQSVRFVIEADFSKAFDSIPHDTLMSVIKEDIKCDKTLKIIENALKAGFIEFGNLHDNLSIGTPQGSILSPLLCNIFLHKLDLFMEEIKTEYQKGTKRQRSVENMKLVNQAKYWRNKGYNKTRPELYNIIIQKLLKSDSIRRDDSYVRVHYIRYADDFVIGIVGSHTLAKEILGRVENFVKEYLNLMFNPEKTRVIDFKKNAFKFLGFNIMAPMSKKGIKPIETIRSNDRIITRRKKTRTVIHMDTDKVLNRLAKNGFIRKRISPTKHNELIYRGTFKGNLINLDHPDILMYYNSVLRDIKNYYSFAKNRVSISWVAWLLKESCALTLGRKFKVKTLAQIFSKFGSDLDYIKGKN